MTEARTSLAEYAATAPTRFDRLEPSDHEKERVEILRGLGLNGQATAIGADEKTSAARRLGFKRCSPEEAVLLMEPRAVIERVNLGVNGWNVAADLKGKMLNRFGGLSRGDYSIGPRASDPFRRMDTSDQAMGWIATTKTRRGLRVVSESRGYVFAGCAQLSAPIPYGVALLLRDVVESRIFDRIGVVALIDQFEAQAGGDPVVLGGIADATVNSWMGMRPHDWFFIALWN